MPLNELTEFRRLERMLKYCRPMGSKSERAFIDQFIRPLGVEQDPAGNLIKRIGNKPEIMYSSHTDSVHYFGGVQEVEYKNGIFELAKPKGNVGWKRGCLGADDAAGVWIMANMIRQKKPGLYIFHRGEEQGCIGSKWLTKNTPGRVKGIKAAIAFDRRGFNDVITHQMGGRCASDAFAASLAKQLGAAYRGAHGVWTDTAQYVELVGECTNVSVGYLNEHTSNECLSFPHALRVLKAMLALDESKLVFEREPGKLYKPVYIYDDMYGDYHPRYSNGYGHNHGATTHAKEASGRTPEEVFSAANKASETGPSFSVDSKLAAEFHAARNDKSSPGVAPGHSTRADGNAYPAYPGKGDYAAMKRLIEDNAEEVADLLEDFGLDYSALAKELYQRGAAIRNYA